MIDSIVKVIRGIVKLRGGTDNTVIGNVSDMLKVTATSSILNGTGSAAALNADLFPSTDVSGYQTASIQISGTWVGTITFQGCDDNSNFLPILATDASDAIEAPETTTTSNGLFYIPLTFRYLRIRMTAYTSGTANLNYTLDTLTSGDLGARVISGTITPGNADKPTYSAAIVGMSPATLATDIFTITGSATKTIRISHIEITATATLNGGATFLLVKRSTANSGGVSSSPTAVRHDSIDAAATATVLAYTTNPTLGTTVGTIRTIRTNTPVVSGQGTPIIWDFGGKPVKMPTLIGTGEVLAINLNATTISGGSVNIDIEWTEE